MKSSKNSSFSFASNKQSRFAKQTAAASVMLLLFGTGSSVSAQHFDCPGVNQQSEQTLSARISDATKLRSAAQDLYREANNLKVRTKKLIADEQIIADAEVIKGAVSSDHFASYAQLLTDYQTALANYLDHRKQVQQHAADFHQMAQADKMLDSAVPTVTMTRLRLTAADECAALQNQETVLAALENNLRSQVDSLVSNRQQMAPTQVQRQAQTLQPNAMQAQQLAMQFEAEVQNKQFTCNKQLQSQIHLAMDAGDAVTNQKLFGEEQRSNTLIQQEVQRAQAHSAIARMLVGKLSLLIGTADASGSPAQNESFVGDDAELSAEYAHVQELYSRLSAARGQH